MPTDQSRICRLQKNEYRTTVPILTEIVEDIVEVSDTSNSSGRPKHVCSLFVWSEKRCSKCLQFF